jgi:hypothetical protein
MQTVVFNTNGSGYWSRAAKAVRIVDMQISWVSDDKEYGELCVYFNTEDWDVNKEGLIYTDNLFLLQLQMFLDEHGLSANVNYSEQGMQGDDYVSLDVGKTFIDSWAAKFGQATVDALVY